MDDPDPMLVAMPPENFDTDSKDDATQALEVLIVQRSDLWHLTPTLEERLIHLANVSLEHSGRNVGQARELSIVLSSDEEVQALNAAYRAKNAPTNVLSFPFDGDVVSTGDDVLPLGDIVLAYETVAREAAELGLDPSHHLFHLTIHGVLHLLGFDHDEDASAEEMEGLESKILKAEGYHDPYCEQDGDCPDAQGATERI